MKRPRDKSFINDPRTPVVLAAFGVFLLWVSFQTLWTRKLTIGSSLFAALVLWNALCAFVPLGVQVFVFVKKKREGIGDGSSRSHKEPIQATETTRGK